MFSGHAESLLDMVPSQSAVGGVPPQYFVHHTPNIDRTCIALGSFTYAPLQPSLSVIALDRYPMEQTHDNTKGDLFLEKLFG